MALLAHVQDVLEGGKSFITTASTTIATNVTSYSSFGIVRINFFKEIAHAAKVKTSNAIPGMILDHFIICIIFSIAFPFIQAIWPNPGWHIYNEHYPGNEKPPAEVKEKISDSPSGLESNRTSGTGENEHREQDVPRVSYLPTRRYAFIWICCLILMFFCAVLGIPIGHDVNDGAWACVFALNLFEIRYIRHYISNSATWLPNKFGAE